MFIFIFSSFLSFIEWKTLKSALISTEMSSKTHRSDSFIAIIIFFFIKDVTSAGNCSIIPEMLMIPAQTMIEDTNKDHDKNLVTIVYNVCPFNNCFFVCKLKCIEKLYFGFLNFSDLVFYAPVTYFCLFFFF